MRVGSGGWQRWWCAGAAVLLAVFVFETWQRLPTADGVRARARDEASRVQYERGGTPEDDPCPDKNVTQYDLSMCEMKAESAVTPTRTASAAAIREAAEVDIRDHLPGRQWLEIGRAFALWLGIVGVAYGLGWGVAKWRRRSRLP